MLETAFSADIFVSHAAKKTLPKFAYIVENS